MKTIYPDVEHGVVNRASGSLFCYQGWPTVARDEKGTLYVVSSSFRVGHVCPFGKTAFYVSHDEGKTWSYPTVINDTYMDDRDAGILYMGNGRLLVTWFTHSAHSYQNRWGDEYRKTHLSPIAYEAAKGVVASYDSLSEKEKMSGSYVRISEDYGITWSETIYVPVSAPHGPTLCRDGTLIYLGKNFYEEDRIHLRDGKKAEIVCFASIDGGYTWEKRSSIEHPSWLTENEYLDEPHVIERSDGQLFGAFRVEGRKPYSVATAISKDRGQTWGEIKCTDVSGSPPHLMFHSSGALICSIGRREAPFGQRAMISYDEGETWSELYVLDERASSNDLGYPSTVELDDGCLLTVYYQKAESDKHCSILYTKWRLEAK